MNKTYLIGSEPSLERMKESIAKWYYGDSANYSFNEVGKNKWEVIGPKGKKDGVIVVKKGRRYRFEGIWANKN